MSDVTQILCRVAAGDPQAAEKLPGDTDGLADFIEDGAFGSVAPVAGT